MKNIYMLLAKLCACITISISFANAQSVGEEFKDCEDCPEMIIIPSGSAMIGVEPFEANSMRLDLPLREVTISYTLAVGKYEITRGQFRQFVNETGYVIPNTGCNTWTHNRVAGFVPEHNWDFPGFSQNDSHPAICISFEEAEAYTKWLADKTGEPYRLLSSTEFEYATRAGTRGPWFWGNQNTDACEYANVADVTFRRLHSYAPVFDCDDKYERTAPVGTYKPNPWGLYDMLGNAWEWTTDCMHLDITTNIPTDGSAWMEENGGNCEYRTPRGGANVSGTEWIRAGAQSGDRVKYHSQLISFRVAKTIE